MKVSLREVEEISASPVSSISTSKDSAAPVLEQFLGQSRGRHLYHPGIGPAWRESTHGPYPSPGTAGALARNTPGGAGHHRRLPVSQRAGSRGLMRRKGFPESDDIRHLVEFVANIRAGHEKVRGPVYSHLIYDILPRREEVVEQPDILILEGLNVLQSGMDYPQDPHRVFVSDFVDFSIYVDADAELLRTCVHRSFLKFRSGASRIPTPISTTTPGWRERGDQDRQQHLAGYQLPEPAENILADPGADQPHPRQGRLEHAIEQIKAAQVTTVAVRYSERGARGPCFHSVVMSVWAPVPATGRFPSQMSLSPLASPEQGSRSSIPGDPRIACSPIGNFPAGPAKCVNQFQLSAARRSRRSEGLHGLLQVRSSTQATGSLRSTSSGWIWRSSRMTILSSPMASRGLGQSPDGSWHPALRHLTSAACGLVASRSAARLHPDNQRTPAPLPPADRATQSMAAAMPAQTPSTYSGSAGSRGRKPGFADVPARRSGTRPDGFPGLRVFIAPRYWLVEIDDGSSAPAPSVASATALVMRARHVSPITTCRSG